MVLAHGSRLSSGREGNMNRIESLELGNAAHGGSVPTTLSLSMVKNEQDIIEAFVRHNIRLLDYMVIVENGSVDATGQILLQLAEEFDNLILAEEDGFAYNQSERMTRWLSEYQVRFGADYVFALDADEFLDVHGDVPFHSVLQEIPEGGYGLIPWCTYVLTPEADHAGIADPLRAMNFRRSQELPPRFKSVIRLDGKSAEDLEITQGNHAVRSKSGRDIAGKRLDGLQLLHYPLRTFDQAKAKSVVGWMAYVAIDPRVSETKKGDQWRVNFDAFVSGKAIDHRALCEMSMLYTQDPRIIDWNSDAVKESSRLVYERHYSTGEGLDAAQLIARSWEESVTHSRRHAPSLKIAGLFKDQSHMDVPEASITEQDEQSIATAQEPADESLSHLIEQGRSAEAMARLEASLLQGETAELWSDWATLQYGSGDTAQAEQGYRRALQLDGSHRQAAVNLGILLVSKGRFQEATAAFKQHESTLTAAETNAIQSMASAFMAASQESVSAEPTPVSKKEKGKYLVIVRAGDSSLHPTWLEGTTNRTWDLIVHSYGAKCPWTDEEGVEVIRATGSDIAGPKMRAMHSLYQQRRSEFLTYDYICFADDDLAASVERFNLMFSMCEHFGLELAQPALTHDSHMGNWGITMENRSFLLRYTNFVEIMCPVFSRAFLELCAPTFLENMTGYGLDILWSSWVSTPWKSGILDACPVRHTRPSFSGQLYKMFKNMGVDKDQELIALIKKWNLVKPEQQIPGKVVIPTAVVHGGVTRDQRRIAAANGQGVELLRALLNGFPKELAINPIQVLQLLYPIMQATMQRNVHGDPDPDRPASEKRKDFAAV